MNMKDVPKYKIAEFQQLPPDELEAAVEAYIEEAKARRRKRRKEYIARYPEKERERLLRYQQSKKGKAKRAEAQRRRYHENPKIREQHREIQRRLKRSPPVEKRREYQKRKYWRNKAIAWLRADPNAVRTEARKHIPNYLMAMEKAEVISMVFAAILNRKIRKDEFAAGVKEVVKAYNRQFDHFKNVSLDAPIAGTDGLTRADLLDSEAFHF